jgi:hypothetical protein
VRFIGGKNMTDKVDTWIWIFDTELNRRKKIRLQTLLDRVNHSFRHENIKYFALKKEREEFREECKS